MYVRMLQNLEGYLLSYQQNVFKIAFYVQIVTFSLYFFCHARTGLKTLSYTDFLDA